MLLLIKYCEPRGWTVLCTCGSAPRCAQEPGTQEVKPNIVKPDQV